MSAAWARGGAKGLVVRARVACAHREQGGWAGRRADRGLRRAGWAATVPMRRVRPIWAPAARVQGPAGMGAGSAYFHRSDQNGGAPPTVLLAPAAPRRRTDRFPTATGWSGRRANAERGVGGAEAADVMRRSRRTLLIACLTKVGEHSATEYNCMSLLMIANGKP